MKIAFDSNILVYLANVWKVEADRDKTQLVSSLIRALPDDLPLVAPFQTFGEAYHVMLRFGFSREHCRLIIAKWAERFETIASSEAAFLSAFDLATDHKLQYWDALIISVAADAGCQLLLSEDLQEGFGWRGVTVVNPFAKKLDHRLARLLSAPE